MHVSQINWNTFDNNKKTAQQLYGNLSVVKQIYLSGLKTGHIGHWLSSDFLMVMAGLQTWRHSNNRSAISLHLPGRLEPVHKHLGDSKQAVCDGRDENRSCWSDVSDNKATVFIYGCICKRPQWDFWSFFFYMKLYWQQKYLHWI